MPKTREIRGRIKAVTNIQRITKTMQMIATARFQAAQKRAVASKPFARKIAEMVGELAEALAGEGAEGGVRHPLLGAPAGAGGATGKQLVLILTSNRGLCGGYNASVLRTAAAFLKANAGGALDVEVVGKKGMGYCRFNRIEVAQFHKDFTDKPTFEQIDGLAQRYMELFTQGKYSAIRVIHMAFQTMSKQSPEVLQLLPLRPPTSKGEGKAAGGKGPATLYDFYPSAAELLAELLPMTVKTSLFQAFNEAVVSEQIARMVAMKSATDAAGKMKNQLNRKYNRARQTAITTELMEVIAGAASVS